MEENFGKELDNKVIKKKRCIPLSGLNKYSYKNTDITEESLKKYKYTLDYDDAKKLGCFKNVDENDLIISINNEISNLNIRDKSITRIESLSKSKLIKFLLYLLNLDLIRENFEIIINEIKSYKLECSLIFKAPIYLGNNELNYYFFCELFVEFFLYNSESENNSSKRNIMFNSKEIGFFPSIDNENSEYSEIDFTDFEKRKKYLKKTKIFQK